MTMSEILLTRAHVFHFAYEQAALAAPRRKPRSWLVVVAGVPSSANTPGSLRSLTGEANARPVPGKWPARTGLAIWCNPCCRTANSDEVTGASVGIEIEQARAQRVCSIAKTEFAQELMRRARHSAPRCC